MPPSRTKKPPGTTYRAKLWCRVRPDEHAAFKHLAQQLDQKPGRLLRRLVRQAVTGGPDYFDDGVLEIRTMHRQLASIGRNLNQLARAVNRGDVIAGEDVRRVVNAGIVQMEAVKGLYLKAVRGTVRRVVLPLYEEAGLSLPKDEEGEDGAATGRPARQPGRGPGRAERNPRDELSG